MFVLCCIPKLVTNGVSVHLNDFLLYARIIYATNYVNSNANCKRVKVAKAITKRTIGLIGKICQSMPDNQRVLMSVCAFIPLATLRDQSVNVSGFKICFTVNKVLEMEEDEPKTREIKNKWVSFPRG